MKNVKNSRKLYVILVLFLAAVFMGCKKDDEQPGPSGSLPNVDFLIKSIDPKDGGTEINDFEAPTTIVLDFPVGFDELNTWRRVEIDYGDGVVDVYDPYDMRVGFKNHVYYNSGKFTVTTRVTNSNGGFRELSKEVEILPMIDLKPFYIDGAWSILTEKTTVGTGPAITKNWSKYQELMTFGTWGGTDFSYNRRSMHWCEFEFGSLKVNGKQVTLTPDVNLTEFFEVTIVIDSFYRIGDKVYMAAQANMLDNDIGQIHYEITLESVSGSGKSDSPYYNFDNTALSRSKISVLEEETKIYAYSDLKDSYSELVETIPKETIPYNLLTVDEYIIDNWNNGTYEEIMGSYDERCHKHFTIKGNDEPIFILYDPEYENSNSDIYSMISSTYYEDNNGRFRVETKNLVQISNGSEATILEDSVVGSWEIVSKKETIDGNDVDPGNSDTPKVGDILTFNADGSADFGGGNEGWFMLDDCNFVILPGSGEILIHLNSYDENTGKMEIMSITHETEDNYKLTFGLLKQ